MKLLIILTFSIFLYSCSKGPVELKYGRDACSECKMVLSDKRFGAEIVTAKGKIYKFDATECMAIFYSKNNEENAKFYVIDFVNSGKLVDATKAIYLMSPELQSPMGKNISAFESKLNLEKVMTEFKGETLSWNNMLMKCTD